MVDPLLKEKLGVGGSLPVLWCCVRSGVYDVSQPFLPVLVRTLSCLSDMQESLD